MRWMAAISAGLSSVALRRGLAIWGPAGLVSALGAMGVLHRLAGPGTRVVGLWHHPDMISNHWLYRWIPGELWNGRSILHNDAYYLPVGDAPFLAGNGGDAVASALLAGPFHWPLSINRWTWLLITGTGLGGAALARSGGAGPGGMAFAALAMVASPYLVGELDGARLAQGSVGAMSLFLALWLWLLREASPAMRLRGGALAGLLFSAAAGGYWYHGLWAAGIGLVWWLIWPCWRVLAGFLPIVVGLLAPLLGLFVSAWAEIPGTQGEDAAFPHPLSRAASLGLGALVGPADQQFGGVIVSLLLVAIALRGARQAWSETQGGRLVVATLGLSLLLLGLCLGPQVAVGDGVWRSTPYRLLYGLHDLTRRFWWPYRHVLPMTLCLLPLLGRGLSDRAGRARHPMALAALGLGLLAELSLRGGRLVATASLFHPSPVWDAVRSGPEGAVVALPLAPAVAGDQVALSQQWVHRRRLLGGHALWVDRVRPRAWDDWRRGHPLWGPWSAFESGEGPAQLLVDEALLARITAEGTRWLVLQEESFPGALRPLHALERSVIQSLWGPPTLADRSQGLEVYDLNAWTGRREADLPSWKIPAPWAERAAGQASVETPTSRTWTTVGEVLPPSGGAR
jgi:hypothetical protein